jgi:hypothetical protein
MVARGIQDPGRMEKNSQDRWFTNSLSLLLDNCLVFEKCGGHCHFSIGAGKENVINFSPHYFYKPFYVFDRFKLRDVYFSL